MLILRYYAILCYAILCYAMLCYAMLYYTTHTNNDNTKHHHDNNDDNNNNNSSSIHNADSNDTRASIKRDVSILSHPRDPQIFGSLMDNYILRKGTRVR